MPPANWNLAMNTSLSSLDPRFQPLAYQFLAQCVEQKILVLITNTRRTAEEQAIAVATGHSQVQHSKHQDGLAIDVVPYAQYILHGSAKLQWDASDPAWWALGKIGEGLGLRWGGRFKPLDARGLGWDPGHMEMVVPGLVPGVPV